MGTKIEEEGSVVYAEHIRFAAEDMGEVQRRLEKNDTGFETQEIERGIEDQIESLIAALKDEQQRREEEKQQPQQSGEMPPGKPKILPPIAELRALRNMQSEVRGRTERLEEVFQRIDRLDLSAEQKRDMKDALLRSVEQTSHRQGKIAELTKKFIEALEGQR